MSEPIKVGDWVMVVRVCCDKYMDGAGPIFRVAKIHGLGRGTICTYCEAITPNTDRAAAEGVLVGVPLPWLKRIPPLSELGDVEHKEEQPA
jgi:hypothetical protein